LGEQLRNAALVALVASAACNGHTLGTSSGTGPQDASASTQTFVGYVEAAKFGSGSDRITMKLTFDGDGPVTGEVTFGEGTLPPPDRAHVYPPGFERPAPLAAPARVRAVASTSIPTKQT